MRKEFDVGEVWHITSRSGTIIAVFLIAMLHANSARAEPPVLSLPLECQPGKTCFIQNYVDVDPSNGVGDYLCRQSSYDGHRGVDFRLLSIRAIRRGVGVLAAAQGVVKAARDGMADRLIAANGAPAIKGRECGNGVVVDHGGGWETQYCHLRKGSLLLTKGDPVRRGQRLGLVGLSGETAFPHVHMTLRYRGKTVDPFSGALARDKKCGPKTVGKTLWQKDLLARLPHISGQLLHMGFAQGGVQKAALMLNGGVRQPRSVRAPALVFYGQALNLSKGDRLSIRLTGPKGKIAHVLSEPMNRHKASYLLFAGKKRPGNAWPRGTYLGTFSLLRKGRQVWVRAQKMELR